MKIQINLLREHKVAISTFCVGLFLLYMSDVDLTQRDPSTGFGLFVILVVALGTYFAAKDD